MRLLIRQGRLTRLLELARSNCDTGPYWCMMVSEVLQAIAVRLATDTLDDEWSSSGEYQEKAGGSSKPRSIDSVLEIDAAELTRLREALDEFDSAYPGVGARLDLTPDSEPRREHQLDTDFR